MTLIEEPAVVTPGVGRVRRADGSRWLFLPPAALLLLGLGGPLAALVASAVHQHGVGGIVSVPFGSHLFVSAALRTLWLSVLVSAITLVLGTVYALAMVLAPRWLAGALAGLLMFSFWISLLVRTYGWVVTLEPGGALEWLAGKLGSSQPPNIYQTLPGLLPPMVHILLPYLVVPVYASLRDIDPRTVRAARSLGAGEWLTLRQVVLPALRSGATAGTVLVFILCLGFYVTPAFLGGPESQLVATQLGTQFGQLKDLGGAAAMGLVLLVVVLAVYWLADRFLGLNDHWGRR
jgi:putative spermidine/putrescine transport system permease protein